LSKSSSSTPLLIGAGIAWAVIALLVFLLFGSPDASGELPSWFLVLITVLETGAFAASSLLCFRNWRSDQIVSGGNVWFWIGAGLLSYTMGNVLFFLWGNVWGLDPAVSLGDFFYILSYIFLAAGMLKAVLPRRLNLDVSQWLIVAGVGLGGLLLAYFLNYQVVEVVPAAYAAPPSTLAQAAPEAAPEEAPEGGSEAVPDAAPEPIAAPVPDPGAAPGWVVSLDSQLEAFEGVVGLLYLLGDTVLLVIAATLLVAFWGGRFSQSWKLIAVAAFCLYVADMFFAYTINSGYYTEGSLWEVFWTFSAVFFGMGAVVEHAVSTQSRRSPRRRRG